MQRNEGGEAEVDDDVLLFIKLGKATDGEHGKIWEEEAGRNKKSLAGLTNTGRKED